MNRLNLTDGEKYISEYYYYSPKIISAIQINPNSEEAFSKLYFELVEPCYNLILNNECSKAFELYCDIFLRIKNQYLVTPS